MINKKLSKALNEQIKWELGAANLYLSMSAYFANMSFTGCASWMRKQYEEENEHALRIFDFLLSCGEDVKLEAVPAPAVKWPSPIAAFKAAAEHEAKVTKQIHMMMAMAKDEKDYISEIFLQWFVNEQVEEEETVKGIIDRFMIVGEKGPGVLALDAELGRR